MMNGGKVARHKINIQKLSAFLTLVITIRDRNQEKYHVCNCIK